MSRNSKILLGVLTFLPFIFFIAYIFSFFFFFTEIPFHDPEIIEEDPRNFFKGIFGAMIWILLAAMLSLGLMIYYLVHSSKNPRIKETERIVWILVLIFASSIGSIVYFIMHIWPLPEKTDDSAVQNYNG